MPQPQKIDLMQIKKALTEQMNEGAIVPETAQAHKLMIDFLGMYSSDNEMFPMTQEGVKNLILSLAFYIDPDNE